jgi:hypothetical protein
MSDMLLSIAGGVAGDLFIAGCAGSYCSTEKGRSWPEGFLLGLVLGPFGVVAAACLPERQRPASPAMLKAVEPPPVAGPIRSRRLLGEIRQDRA